MDTPAPGPDEDLDLSRLDAVMAGSTTRVRRSRPARRSKPTWSERVRSLGSTVTGRAPSGSGDEARPVIGRSRSRRTSETERRLVFATAVLAGVLGALSDAEPTGLA